jgi:hypothetical protein
MKPGIKKIVGWSLALLVALPGVNTLAGGFVDLYPGDFTNVDDTHNITNPWWPLTDHDRWVYFEEEECVLGVVDVLPGTSKTIKGVNVRTVLDTEYEWDSEDECPDPDEGDVVDYGNPSDDWKLVEKTHDWYAQDNDGHVWYFGEISVATDSDEDCDTPITAAEPPFFIDGCLDGSWEAGFPDEFTLEGIIMLNIDPENLKAYKGLFYFQEYWEDEATDMGKILNFKDVETILHDDQEDCLVTKEWVPLEPGEVEHKYYCYGFGLEFVEGNAGGPTVYEELIAVED